MPTDPFDVLNVHDETDCDAGIPPSVGKCICGHWWFVGMDCACGREVE